MKMDRVKAYILVSIQAICLLAIFASGAPLASRLPLAILEISGVALGIWATIAMGRGNINITPLVKREARLVTSGPYAAIRHPMYAALLLASWPLIIDSCSLIRLSTGLVLTVDLIVKLLYEEHLLRQHFAGYDAYARSTKRLIPFVW
ncbi:MAG: methyltransferase family protein [Syntrophales bacterium]